MPYTLPDEMCEWIFCILNLEYAFIRWNGMPSRAKANSPASPIQPKFLFIYTWPVWVKKSSLLCFLFGIVQLVTYNEMKKRMGLYLGSLYKPENQNKC